MLFIYICFLYYWDLSHNGSQWTGMFSQYSSLRFIVLTVPCWCVADPRRTVWVPLAGHSVQSPWEVYPILVWGFYWYALQSHLRGQTIAKPLFGRCCVMISNDECSAGNLCAIIVDWHPPRPHLPWDSIRVKDRARFPMMPLNQPTVLTPDIFFDYIIDLEATCEEGLCSDFLTK